MCGVSDTGRGGNIGYVVLVMVVHYFLEDVMWWKKKVSLNFMRGGGYVG